MESTTAIGEFSCWVDTDEGLVTSRLPAAVIPCVKGVNSFYLKTK